MKRISRLSSNLLEITEAPLPLYGWKPEDRFALDIIEQDLRSLINRVAEGELSRREDQEQVRKDKSRLLLAILEAIDAFERVFLNIHTKQDQITIQMKKWIGNFRTIYRMLRNTLEEQGVARIENLDEGFDPYWHRAIETVEDHSKPEGTIVEEIRPGYLWQGQILRKAEVNVVRNAVSEDNLV